MFTPQQDPKTIFDRIFNSTGALLKGGLNKGADTAEGLYNNFHSAAEQTGVPQAIGGATGALGGAIGGAVGGLGNFFSQSLQGKGLDPKLMGQDIANTARSTANFGYQTGKEGAIAAPMSNAGKIVSGAMSIPPIRDVVSDVRSGNVNLGTGLKAGAAAASLYGAAKSPNWTPGGVLDPQLKALASRVKDAVGVPGGMTMHKANYEMLAKAIRDADIPDTEKQGFLRSLYPNLKSDNQSFDSSRFDEAVNSGSLFRKSSASPKMSRGDYELVADAIKSAVDNGDITPQSAQAIYSSMQSGLSSANPRFDLERFTKAAGLNKSPGQIVNSMDDGLDTSSNYGENLMNNDGGASPSVMKGGKQLLPQTSKNSINTYSDGTFKYKDPTGGLENIDSATSRYTPSHSASGDFVDIPLPKPSKISITAEEAAGSRYPLQVYQAVKGYFGKNLASSDIDNMPFNQVREAAGMSMPGGKEMFDQVMKQTYPSLGDNLAPIVEMQRTPRPVPGKWSDAYKRPMDTGIGLGGATGDVGRGLTYPQLGQTYPQMGQVSVPRLTPAQTGAVSKIIKQSQALRNAMRAYQSGDMTDEVSMSTKDTSKMDFTDPSMVDKFGYKTSTPNIPHSDMKQVIEQARGGSKKVGMSSYDAVGLAEGWIDGSEKEVKKAWQYLVDTGMVNQLQGWFGRTAKDMIDSGYLKPPKK